MNDLWVYLILHPFTGAEILWGYLTLHPLVSVGIGIIFAVGVLRAFWWGAPDRGTYFNVEIAQGVTARFKRHPTTGQLLVFRANCANGENVWNEPGYGYGKWERV